MRSLKDFDYFGKRVFLRLDLNVPVSNEVILDKTRIIKVIPTIKYLIANKAKVIIASHFGRPKSGYESKYSIEFLVEVLEKELNQKILFCSDYLDNQAEYISNSLVDGQILLLENLRFHSGETENDMEFAQKLAILADFYVNDAFSCSHRSHASIEAIARLLPSAAGLLLFQEIEGLKKYLDDPKKPVMAIIGGSKISTKLDLLKRMINKVDYLSIGGAMANTFLKSLDYEIGNSFYEEDLVETARWILSNAGKCKIILPRDVVVAKKVASDVEGKVINIDNIEKDEMILDLGPESIFNIISILDGCKTVVLNGPVGMFEYEAFSKGTYSLALAVASLTQDNKIISVAGGGDMVAALSKSKLLDQISYISTAGGAFLEWLEGKELPGLKVLEN